MIYSRHIRWTDRCRIRQDCKRTPEWQKCELHTEPAHILIVAALFQYFCSDIPSDSSQKHGSWSPVIPNARKATVVVVGCAAVDVTSQVEVLIRPDQKSTYPGRVSVSLGGVARNIAEAAHRVMSGSTGNNATTLLVAPIGDDEFGKLISTMTESLGMRADGLMSMEGRRSAVCNLLLDSHGELQCGVSDMDLPHVCESDRVSMTSTEHS